MEEFSAYANLVVGTLLALEEGEDLFINTPSRFHFFARLVEKAAMARTRRQVTVVLTKAGRQTGLAVNEPEEGMLPRCKARALLCLKAPQARMAPSPDFEEDAQDFPLMMRYGHLAEPLDLGRRIGSPFCAVPCRAQDDQQGWRVLLSSPLMDPASHARHEEVLRRLNTLSPRRLRLSSPDGALEVELDPRGRFCGSRIVLEGGRGFFTDLDTGSYTANIARADGAIAVKGTLMGHQVEETLSLRDGRVEATGGVLGRFLALERSLGRLATLTLSEDGLVLGLGPSRLECLREIPLAEKDLPPAFSSSVFKAELRSPLPRIEAETSDGESLALANDGRLLV